MFNLIIQLESSYPIYNKYIFSIIKKYNIKIKYKIISNCPKKKKIIVIKSPHVNNKAREQFQLKIYKKKIVISSEDIFRLISFLLFLNQTCKFSINTSYSLKYVYSLTG